VNIESQPLVSVIIPCYKSRKFIDRSLGSVLEQTYHNFEVLIVDNSSNDGLEKYVRELNDDRIQFFAVENEGVIGLSRNIGIDNASGDYVAFLDSDDSWESKKLEKVMEVMVANPSIDIVVHAQIEYRENGTQRIVRFGKINSPAYDSLLFERNRLTPSATLIKKSVLEKCGGFSEKKEFISAEDYDLWLKAARMGTTFYYLDELLGGYHRHGEAVTKGLFKHIESVIYVFQIHLYCWAGINKASVYTVLLKYSCFRLRTVISVIRQSRFIDLVVHPYFIIVFLSLLPLTFYPGFLLDCFRATKR